MIKEMYIDVETTGVMHWKNGVHQISGAVYIDNEHQDEFNFKIRPHDRAVIDQKALDIGGVTKEQIMAYPHRVEVKKEFDMILSQYVDKFDRKDKFHFVAYNAHFDNAFMRAFFAQTGDNYFGSYFWSSNIDVMVLAAERLKGIRHTMENFKLMTVARELGIEIDESKLHDAQYDIHITREIYLKLQK